jgi:23S rRNA A2030 N6-methylase RlmJ
MHCVDAPFDSWLESSTELIDSTGFFGIFARLKKNGFGGSFGLLPICGITEQDGGDDYKYCYPGSPWIAKSLCRTQHSLLFCENQPEQLQMRQENNLRLLETTTNTNKKLEELASTNNIRFICDHGYKALKQRKYLDTSQRALIFINLLYQARTNLSFGIVLANALELRPIGHLASRSARNRKQWSTIKLYELIKSAVDRGKEILEMEMHPSENNNNACYMVGTGAGMVTITVNLPYGIEKELQDMLPQLDPYLSPRVPPPPSRQYLSSFCRGIKDQSINDASSQVEDASFLIYVNG